jgi:hypothetical protein
MRPRHLASIAAAAAVVAVCTALAVAVSTTHGADSRAAANPIAAADPQGQQAYIAGEMAKTISEISHDLDDPETGWAGTTHRVTLLSRHGKEKRYADRTQVYGFGSPLTVYTVERASVPGATIDLYHPGGWHDDLLLLGAAYRSLAPTPWVELTIAHKRRGDPRSAYPSSADPCAYPGPHQQLCWIRTALNAAAHTMPTDQRRYRLRRNTNKHSLVLETDVQLRNAMSTGLVVLRRADADSLTPGIRNAYLRITIAVREDGNHTTVKQIHVRGTASAADLTLVVDDGYDWNAASDGQAGLADFPAVPLLFDVTRLTTANQKQHFDDQLRRLRAKKIGP